MFKNEDDLYISIDALYFCAVDPRLNNHIFLVFILGLLALSSSCVLKSQHDQTVASYAKAASDISTLQNQNEDLKKEIKKLSSSNDDLSARNEELSQTNMMLVGKNKELSQKDLELRKEKIQASVQDSKSKASMIQKNKMFECLSLTFENDPHIESFELSMKGSVISFYLSNEQLFNKNKLTLTQDGLNRIKSAASCIQNQGDIQLDVKAYSHASDLKKLSSKANSVWEHASLKAAMVCAAFHQNDVADSLLSAQGFGYPLNLKIKNNEPFVGLHIIIQ